MTNMELSAGNPSRNVGLEAALEWGGCCPWLCGTHRGVPKLLGEEDGLDRWVWGVPASPDVAVLLCSLAGSLG